MGLGFLGGIANSYNGIQKGQDEQLAREQLASENANRKSQQIYQDGVQADEAAGRQRANTLRTDIAAIPESRTVQTPQAGPGLEQANGSEAPMAPLTTTTKVPLDEQLRMTASAQRKAGNMEGYLAATGEADKIGHARSAKVANEVLSASQGMTPFQLANAAKSAYDGDPFPGKMGNIVENSDGSVNVTATNRDTGLSTTRTYKTTDELRDGISAHYSPENFAALQTARLAEARKMREEDNKVHIVPAGGTLAKNSGKPLLTNDNGFLPVTNPDGTQGLVRTSGKLGVGAGQEALAKTLDGAVALANSGNVKLEGEQLMTMRRLTEQIHLNSGTKVVPSLAAEVAYKVALDPKLSQPQIDPATGNINNIYQHPTLGPIVVDPGIATARRPGSLKPEAMQAITKQFVDSMPKADSQGLVAAAFDKTKVKPILDDLYAQIDAQAAQNLQNNPKLTPADQAQYINNYKQTARESLQKKLDLVSMNYKQPAPEPKAGAGNKFSTKNLLKGFGIGYDDTPSPDSTGEDFESMKARTAREARIRQADPTYGID